MGKYVKGQSGNVAGRPPTVKPYKELASAFIECLQANNNERLKNIVEKLVSKAEEGDLNAINLVLSRYAGAVAKSPADNETPAEMEVTVFYADAPKGDKDGIDTEMF